MFRVDFGLKTILTTTTKTVSDSWQKGTSLDLLIVIVVFKSKVDSRSFKVKYYTVNVRTQTKKLKWNVSLIAEF